MAPLASDGTFKRQGLAGDLHITESMPLEVIWGSDHFIVFLCFSNQLVMGFALQPGSVVCPVE